MSNATPSIDGATIPATTLAQEVWRRCDLICQCTDTPGCVDRPYLGPGMGRAHEVIRGWMEQAGLRVRVDAVGNIVGRLASPREDAPVLLLGSHLDSVPHGGKYDGVLGVLVALACAQALRGVPLPFHIDVIGFSEEEGVRYRMAYLGSHAIAGQFDPAWLDRTDSAGVSMAQAIRDFGLDPSQIPAAAYERSRLLGYVEVHLEQGPILEVRGLPIGIVTAIAGQTRLRLRFSGKAGHAGTTPMTMRADALVPAAMLISFAHDYGRAIDDLRVTVGVVHNQPNVANVIPGTTEISLDVRHPDDAVREKAVADLIAQARRLAQGANVGVDVLDEQSHGATPADPKLVALLSDAVGVTGTAVLQMVSGAGHDGVAVAAACGTAMLFVRHPGGISHHPDEMVQPADIAVAIDVMLGFLRRLAASNNP